MEKLASLGTVKAMHEGDSGAVGIKADLSGESFMLMADLSSSQSDSDEDEDSEWIRNGEGGSSSSNSKGPTVLLDTSCYFFLCCFQARSISGFNGTRAPCEDERVCRGCMHV